MTLLKYPIDTSPSSPLEPQPAIPNMEIDAVTIKQNIWIFFLFMLFSSWIFHKELYFSFHLSLTKKEFYHTILFANVFA